MFCRKYCVYRNLVELSELLLQFNYLCPYVGYLAKKTKLWQHLGHRNFPHTILINHGVILIKLNTFLYLFLLWYREKKIRNSEKMVKKEISTPQTHYICIYICTEQSFKWLNKTPIYKLINFLVILKIQEWNIAVLLSLMLRSMFFVCKNLCESMLLGERENIFQR